MKSEKVKELFKLISDRLEEMTDAEREEFLDNAAQLMFKVFFPKENIMHF